MIIQDGEDGVWECILGDSLKPESVPSRAEFSGSEVSHLLEKQPVQPSFLWVAAPSGGHGSLHRRQ